MVYDTEYEKTAEEDNDLKDIDEDEEFWSTNNKNNMEESWKFRNRTFYIKFQFIYIFSLFFSIFFI